MSETLFYQLDHHALEDILPGLLDRTRARGQKALVRLDSAERLSMLDAHLWTYDEASFLAHGGAEDGHDARQPIYLTTEDENPNAADVLFLAGVWPADWAATSLAVHGRIVALFDGSDEAVLTNARAQWGKAKAAGHFVTYWKQDENGKWEKRG